MPFDLIDPERPPRRCWAIVGPPGVGKTTFAASMRGPLLPIDADGRFDNTARKLSVKSFKFSPHTHEQCDIRAIERILQANVADAPTIGTIIVDSLSGILEQLRARTADLDSKRKDLGFSERTTLLTRLLDTTNAWGTDVLYVWHVRESMQHGKAFVRESVTDPEWKRIKGKLTAKLELITDNGTRAVRVDWNRNEERPVSGLFHDLTGRWLGMPERLDLALEGHSPFAANRDAAMAWAINLKACASLEEAAHEYSEVKTQKEPKKAHQMWDAWIEHAYLKLARNPQVGASTSLETATAPRSMARQGG